jgi:hypothetical protein
MNNTPSQIGAEIANDIHENLELAASLELEKIIGHFANGMRLPSTSPEFAEEIMDRNYLGPADAAKFFGVSPTFRKSTALSEVPWDEETLITFSQTHILVAMPPLSILKLRTIVTKRYGGERLFYKQDDYDHMAFAMDEGEVSWRLLRKTPVEKSLCKLWSHQEWLLSPTETVPSTQVIVYVMLGHFLKTGERIFEKTTVRTDDICPNKRRAHAGNYDDMGFDIGFFPDELPDPTLGIAAEQKPWRKAPKARTT